MTLNLDRGSWKRVAFGDVVRNLNVTVRDAEAAGIDRVIAMEHLDPGELRISRWGTVEDGSTFTRRVRPGQTLFGKRRAYQRKAAFAEFDAITSGDILVFEADDTQLLPELLPFLVRSEGFYDHALGTSAGSLSPRTNWRDLANYEFELPSVDEQQHLVRLLWAVERHLGAVRQVRGVLKEAYLQARLALLTVGPNGPWRTAAVPLDAADFWTRNVPKGWTAATVSDVSTVRSGATPSRSQQARYFDGGTIPWVKTLDLNESVILVTDERITDSAVSETSAVVLPEGTVLVAMYGGFGQIGRTARLGVDAATNQAVSALLDLRKEVLPQFMHEVLKAGRSKWRKVAASSRKDPNITKRDVERFDFPLPPVGEQKQILDLLALIQGAIHKSEKNSASLTVSRRALLADIFRGGR
ncbi:restriction endonuclease subunit S [Micromonospora antibiotica]|uniref:Restriction endonuclease subunit S n=1 Tax=Micromonospora antibiotica TaxID=2807623 RepID=A0ABS3V7P3_9ACTN|nr:restriction endonuclease subunit S [Micromonospora antibiotica]MBO4161629.1 restriction endonuclease subunit S [Micromonospora antibiotica]